MSLGDLQEWLMDEGIQSELSEVIRQTVATELDNLVPESRTVPSPSVDWSRLLLAGSILARSEHRQYQEAALRIATGAVTLSDSDIIKDAGAVLLGKLSNFRAIALAAERDILATDLDGRIGLSLRLETQRREMDQAILVESSGQWLRVNDFQKRFWNDATNHDWLSASAPTASGKTFLVLQWLIDQMRSTGARVSVYLAPTRALVSEIENALLDLLNEDSGVQVSSLPLREKYDAALVDGSRLILVFTQERLHLLANVLSDEIKIDLLIVDEAHKIGENQRGVILQDAIERACRANSSLKLVFISPSTQNPEELLADAPDGITLATVDSDAPTVLQNVILAEQVPRKPKLWKLSIRQPGADIEVGVLQLASSPATLRKRLAFVAAAAGERGGTLVYANGAAEAEEIAGLISQLLSSDDQYDAELMELADLARKGVHPQFNLGPLVMGWTPRDDINVS